MSQSIPNFLRSTFGLTLLGGGLLWLALPPVGWTPLAWIAPVFWVLLIRAEKLPKWEVKANSEKRRGPWLLLLAAAALFAAGMCVMEWFHDRQYHLFSLAELVYWPLLFAIFVWAARRWAGRPYGSLWLAYMLFWLADVQWIRLPYWAIGFGWLALGIYFGLYMPVFIGVSRYAVHRLKLPLILVVPVIFTGLELAQAHLLSGMTMGCLEHTQYRWTGLIQISDLTGCYGVTFLMMFVAACLARMLPWGGKPWSVWPLAPAASLVACTLLYGYWRTSHDETLPGLKIGLIQGNIDVRLENPPGFGQSVFEQYFELTKTAIGDSAATADLIVWPETVFGWVTAEPNALKPPNYVRSEEDFRDELSSDVEGSWKFMRETTRRFDRPVIFGVERQHFNSRGSAVYNTAVFVTPDGHWRDLPPDRYFYDKTHLVPFGEYMPFADLFPWLQTLSPLGSGSSASDRPACFVVKNINLVPNICYETTLPYVIRGQLVELRKQGVEPQVLVNVTNDGWFWGSAELEQHLACGVYRAVENRRPLVIAANTGISAWIDGNGRIVAHGPKHDTGTILADVRLDNRESWYSLHGDWFAGTCLAAACALATIGMGESAYRRFLVPKRGQV